MKPAGHIVISSAIGLTVAATTDTPWAMATALVPGVLVDVDHVLDYYQWFIRRKTDRVFYLLHGWEYALLLAVAGLVLSWHPLVLGAFLGYLSHIVADQLVNKAYPLTYSLAYRARHGFLMSRVSPWTIEGSTADLAKVLTAFPMGKKLFVLVMGKRRAGGVLNPGAEEEAFSTHHHLGQGKATGARPWSPTTESHGAGKSRMGKQEAMRSATGVPASNNQKDGGA